MQNLHIKDGFNKYVYTSEVYEKFIKVVKNYNLANKAQL